MDSNILELYKVTNSNTCFEKMDIVSIDTLKKTRVRICHLVSLYYFFLTRVFWEFYHNHICFF
jgi:hypothetical protein